MKTLFWIALFALIVIEGSKLLAFVLALIPSAHVLH